MAEKIRYKLMLLMMWLNCWPEVICKSDSYWDKEKNQHVSRITILGKRYMLFGITFWKQTPNPDFK